MTNPNDFIENDVVEEVEDDGHARLKPTMRTRLIAAANEAKDKFARGEVSGKAPRVEETNK